MIRVMPLNSVNTNTDAAVALQNLNSTNQQISSVQNEVNTGYAISSPTDNGAVWAIAQGQRAQVASLGSVVQSLQRGQSAVDVALSAGQTVSDLLVQIKTKVLAAADTSLDSSSRGALNNDFKSLLGQITTVVSNANFNGVNLLTNGAADYSALANADATSTITVAAEDLSLGGSNIAISATASFNTATAAQSLIATVNSSITNVSTALGELGTGSNALTSQLSFVNNLSGTLNTGIGNLVDADLAQASAQLQALQTKQQLGVQALSIANGESSSLLSLFRNIS
jgi:flagellin